MVAKVSRGSALRVEIELADGSRVRPLAWKYTERPLAATCGQVAGVATRSNHLLGIGWSGHSVSLAWNWLEWALAATCSVSLGIQKWLVVVTCSHWLGPVWSGRLWPLLKIFGSGRLQPLAVTCGGWLGTVTENLREDLRA